LRRNLTNPASGNPGAVHPKSRVDPIYPHRRYPNLQIDLCGIWLFISIMEEKEKNIKEALDELEVKLKDLYAAPYATNKQLNGSLSKNANIVTNTALVKIAVLITGKSSTERFILDNVSAKSLRLHLDEGRLTRASKDDIGYFRDHHKGKSFTANALNLARNIDPFGARPGKARSETQGSAQVEQGPSSRQSGESQRHRYIFPLDDSARQTPAQAHGQSLTQPAPSHRHSPFVESQYSDRHRSRAQDGPQPITVEEALRLAAHRRALQNPPASQSYEWALNKANRGMMNFMSESFQGGQARGDNSASPTEGFDLPGRAVVTTSSRPREQDNPPQEYASTRAGQHLQRYRTPPPGKQQSESEDLNLIPLKLSAGAHNRIRLGKHI
jgi:hypothetical protein